MKYNDRKYEATYDNGRDYGTFVYTSGHRNGSKANMEDARQAMISRYGFHARSYTIISTCRTEAV